MPNQYCLGVTKCWFRVDILGQEIPNLHYPYTQHCMICGTHACVLFSAVGK